MYVFMEQVSKLKNSGKIAQKQDRFLKFEVYADTKLMSTKWSNYGYTTAPLMYRKTDGGFVNQSGYNILMKNFQFQKLLKSAHAIIPHEEVEKITKSVVNNDLKDQTLKIKQSAVADHGYTKYWTYLSDSEFTVVGSDKIKIGFVVRNGIGTYVALGVDLYTMRLVCENGAVAKGPNLESFALAHVGDPQKIIKMFEVNIRQALKGAEELILFYKKAAEIKVTNELANQMYKRMGRLGETYLPDNWKVKPAKEIAELRKAKKFNGLNNLVSVKKEVSLWKTFNDITQIQRDRLKEKKVGFQVVARQQTKLHQAMINVIQTKGGI